jgi:hypothetical protein
VQAARSYAGNLVLTELAGNDLPFDILRMQIWAQVRDRQECEEFFHLSFGFLL